MIEMTTYPTMPPKESNAACKRETPAYVITRSEEHTSELQSQSNLVCRLLLEKKKKNTKHNLYQELASQSPDIQHFSVTLTSHIYHSHCMHSRHELSIQLLSRARYP